MDSILDNILATFPDAGFLKADGHDNVIIGVDENTMRLCYSKQIIIENLLKDMPEDEAEEFYDYNIAGAHVGDDGPIFITMFT